MHRRMLAGIKFRQGRRLSPSYVEQCVPTVGLAPRAKPPAVTYRPLKMGQALMGGYAG